MVNSRLSSLVGKPYFKQSTIPYVYLFTCLSADHNQIFIAAFQTLMKVAV